MSLTDLSSLSPSLLCCFLSFKNFNQFFPKERKISSIFPDYGRQSVMAPQDMHVLMPGNNVRCCSKKIITVTDGMQVARESSGGLTITRAAEVRGGCD